MLCIVWSDEFPVARVWFMKDLRAYSVEVNEHTSSILSQSCHAYGMYFVSRPAIDQALRPHIVGKSKNE